MLTPSPISVRIVVIGPFGDRLLKDRRIRCQTPESEVYKAGQLSRPQKVALDEVEPDRLADGPGLFHSVGVRGLWFRHRGYLSYRIYLEAAISISPLPQGARGEIHSATLAYRCGPLPMNRHKVISERVHGTRVADSDFPRSRRSLPVRYTPTPLSKQQCSYPAAFRASISRAFTFSRRRLNLGGGSNVAPTNPATRSFARLDPIMRAPRHRMFMSSCSTPCRAE